MAIDPQVQFVCDITSSEEVVDPDRTVDETRASYRTLYAAFDSAAPKPEVGGLDDRLVPGPGGDIAVRVYRPDGIGRTGALVWFHGGGHAIGDLETADTLCRRFCVGAGITVVSVDYRLAPEHPYPKGLDDAWAALCWVSDHADELRLHHDRIAVGGDSAGGNLAALCALRARDTGLPLALQLLVYPGVDLTGSFPSIDENGTGRLLTAARMAWFHDHYLGARHEHGDPTSPDVSPLFADVAGVARARVVTAALDPLRDEGNAYARRLSEAGVDVELDENPDLIHLFFDQHHRARRRRGRATGHRPPPSHARSLNPEQRIRCPGFKESQWKRVTRRPRPRPRRRPRPRWPRPARR